MTKTRQLPKGFETTPKQKSTLKAVRQLFVKRGYKEEGRELCITPCYGNYAATACVVLTMNGSPPRGIYVVTMHFTGYAGVFIDQDKNRKISPAEAKVLKEFLDVWCPHRNGVDWNLSPVVIRGEQDTHYIQDSGPINYYMGTE